MYKKEKISVKWQKYLLKTIQKCIRLIKAFKANLKECLPLLDDLFLIKGKKVIKNIKIEKNIVEI